MKYEIVNLNEKQVVGLSARTNNHDPKMGEIIGGLWMMFHQDGIFENIREKANMCSIGMYSDYESDMNGEYDITVCSEVLSRENQPGGTVLKSIPAGKYAKFLVKGHMQKACIDFWTKLWTMDLERAYTCDFEEYQPGGDIENSEIHMYISIK